MATASQDTDSNRIDLLQSQDLSQYLLNTRGEILYVLRALRDAGALLTAYFNEGRDFILTSVLDAGDAGVTLDVGSDPERNARAMASDKLICAGLLDRIRIQFTLHRLRSVTHEGRPALAANLPETLLRLQRREFYRLTAPVGQPVKCRIPCHHPGAGQRTIEAKVLDISGGGLAIVMPPEGVRLEPGLTFPGCRIDLPEIGTVVATLEVRSVFDMSLANRNVVQRAGCQFVDLPGTMLTMIQRYIIRVERERKARAADL